MFYTEILKIIEGGLDKNQDKVQSYATLLAEKLSTDGDQAFAERIKRLLSKKTVHPVYLDEFMKKPVDQDTRLDMVEIYIPGSNEYEEIILPEITQLKVSDFTKTLKYKDEFVRAGIVLPDSLLLYGPPGCGKTSIARYISQQISLPMVTVKLDGLISSLLGSTAKNLRKVFEYAKERPCILFLDEFDAIAKARNDDHEVGELKRIVNSLLQNIDDFNENNILIAATNHEALLDPAVWRRFAAVIQVPKPSESELIKIVNLFLMKTEYEFQHDKKKLEKVSGLLLGLSPADVKVICYNSIRKSIINREAILSYATFLMEVYLFKANREQDKTLVQFLNDNGLSQKDISDALGISLRQIRKQIGEGRNL